MEWITVITNVTAHVGLADIQNRAVIVSHESLPRTLQKDLHKFRWGEAAKA